MGHAKIKPPSPNSFSEPMAKKRKIDFLALNDQERRRRFSRSGLKLFALYVVLFVTVSVLVFTLFWNFGFFRVFANQWLLHCWPGIDCGDAGGWFSAIGTLGAVAFGTYQLWTERQWREDRLDEDIAGRVSVVIGELSGAADASRTNLRILQLKGFPPDYLLAYCVDHPEDPFNRLIAMRASFEKLPVELVRRLTIVIDSLPLNRSLRHYRIQINNIRKAEGREPEVLSRDNVLAELSNTALELSSICGAIEAAVRCMPSGSKEFFSSEVEAVEKWHAEIKSAKDFVAAGRAELIGSTSAYIEGAEKAATQA